MDQETIFARLMTIISRYLQDRETGPFVRYLDPGELRRRLQLSDPRGRGDWEELFSWVELYLAHAVKTNHPTYLNRMWAGANLPSIIGDMIVALTNTSACTFETAPVSTLMEKYLLATMLDIVGWADGTGQMTTGSSNANMIAMLAARNSAAAACKEQGLFGSGRLVAFVNEDAHYSMDRAANILGLGTANLVKVPVDGHGRMQVPALEALLAEAAAAGHHPFFVAATAGTTVRGAYDPLPPLIELKRRTPFWLHVDGAWGGAVLFSDRLRPQFLSGLEQADSFTLDFHKMLGTALMCNVLLFNRRPELLREALSAGDESYIFRDDDDGEIRDLGTMSLQCGRRVDSLKWFLDWKFYGRAGFAQRVEKYLELCQYAEARVMAEPELELAAPRESFNICFRYRIPDGMPSDPFIRTLRERLQRSGESLVGTGNVGGRLALRLLITNNTVDQGHIDSFLAAVLRLGREMVAGQEHRGSRSGPER